LGSAVPEQRLATQTSPSPQQQHSPGQEVAVSLGQLPLSRQQIFTPSPVPQSLWQFSSSSVTSHVPFPQEAGEAQGLAQSQLKSGHV
jgi:hypothetical protein